MKCGGVITGETRKPAVITERASLPTWLEKEIARQDTPISELWVGRTDAGTDPGWRAYRQ